MKIAIQGDRGSFHHQAAIRHFGDDISLVCCETFADVFGALNRHEADTALVAIENSLYGSINEVYDLLESHRYPITGELFIRIHQQLIGLPGAKLADIHTVYSHPVALAQCEQYLNVNLPQAKRTEYHDTAAAAEFVHTKQNSAIAAIASSEAARLYDLSVIAQNIEDNANNYTRFVSIGRTADTNTASHSKASLVIETDHTPGALARVLGIFADNGVNMTKLQSRPIPGKVWTYRFYIDIECAGPKLHDLLATIRSSHSANVIILGQYVQHPPLKL